MTLQQLVSNSSNFSCIRMTMVNENLATQWSTLVASSQTLAGTIGGVGTGIFSIVLYIEKTKIGCLLSTDEVIKKS